MTAGCTLQANYMENGAKYDLNYYHSRKKVAYAFPNCTRIVDLEQP